MVMVWNTKRIFHLMLNVSKDERFNDVIKYHCSMIRFLVNYLGIFYYSEYSIAIIITMFKILKSRERSFISGSIFKAT